MKTDPRSLSNGFQRLYCDPALFASFSVLHPISFARVLPFQPADPIMDEFDVVEAEEAHLAQANDHTRLQIIDAYRRRSLLQESEAANLQTVLDFFDADFFELMGLVYANAGMFRCALRWYRERIAGLETQNPHCNSETESVYASVGYCLCSLGLFAEAIAWSKACIGPRAMADAVCLALIACEADPAGGTLRAIERAGARTRYILSAPDPAQACQAATQLESVMQAIAPFQESQIQWISDSTPGPEIQPDGYPFKAESDAGTLPRHKMNLIFATCGQADALAQRGYILEAKRLLHEAALLEPAADPVWERIRALA